MGQTSSSRLTSGPLLPHSCLTGALFKVEFRKPDGRLWIEYSDRPFPKREVLHPGSLRPPEWKPPQMRYNAHRGEWVTYAPHRQNRPFLPPPEFCPLCPQKPESFDSLSEQKVFPEPPLFADRLPYLWAVFENVFPGLSLDDRSAPTGHCEVVLYSPDHSSTLAACKLDQIRGLIGVWQDRSRCLGADPRLNYVYLFENKGTEIGVTLHHPHGQLYAFTKIPPFIEAELRASSEYYQQQGECLHCVTVAKELECGVRVVAETDHLIAFVPEAARYPYEVHLTTKSHRERIEHLTASESTELAQLLSRVLRGYNALFDFEMPYVMAHHQAPCDGNEYPHYHWHIEIYPPYRSATRLKYLAGVESGTGMFINDTLPEKKAAELRGAIQKAN